MLKNATCSTFNITSHINRTWLNLTVSAHCGSITDSLPSWHWYLSWTHIEYIAYWFTYSSANHHCSLNSLWTDVKVIHSPNSWLATQPAGIGLAWCPPGGLPIPTAQPRLLAGMRPGRGVMAVGNWPLFPSTVCQSVSQWGSRSVNIFVTAQESARPLWVGGCTSKVKKENMIVLSHLI